MRSAFQNLPDETLRCIVDYAIPQAQTAADFDQRKAILVGLATLSQSCARVARFLLLEHIYLDDFLSMAGFAEAFDRQYEMRRVVQHRNKSLTFDGRELKPKESTYWVEEVLKRLPPVTEAKFVRANMCLTSLSIASLLTKLQLVRVELSLDLPSLTPSGMHTLFLPHLTELVMIGTCLSDANSDVSFDFFLRPTSLPSLARLALVYYGSFEYLPPLCPQLTHLLLRRLDPVALLPRQLSVLPRLRHLSLDLLAAADFEGLASTGVPASLVSLEITEMRAPELERKLLARDSLVGRGIKYLLVDRLNVDQYGGGRDGRVILRAANQREADTLGIELWDLGEKRKGLPSVKAWFKITDRLEQLPPR
ncbi:hypothetical protein JCM11491_006845 [Sporobolomyces phaffii]